MPAIVWGAWVRVCLGVEVCGCVVVGPCSGRAAGRLCAMSLLVVGVVGVALCGFVPCLFVACVYAESV